MVLGLALSHQSFAQKVSEREQLISIAMRQVGHDVLLSVGDDASRVMPVQKIKERFRVSFENEFTFNPDRIIEVLISAMVKSNVSENYILEIQKCESDEVVHALVVGGPGNDVIPCGKRDQPKDCYEFYLTILDHKDLAVTTESSSIKSSYSTGFLIISGLILAVFSFLLWKKKSTQPNLENQTGVEIGDFILEPNSMRLILKGVTEQLSGKECELLLLLNNHRNENVERKTILKEVWGDQGGYVGRTLDVFISKLRKKLQADSNVEIKNIRGVGYRLIVS